MNVQSFSDIYKKEKDLFVSNQSKITDLNDGSIIGTSFEAVARVVERLYIDVRNGYSNNLLALAYSIFGFKRKDGVKAHANVVFSRTKAISRESIISVGTRISTGTYVFVTTAIGKINAGELNSNLVPVQAEEIGVEYNVAANTINTIETVLSEDIVTVTNPAKASDGSSAETETEMLARFKTYINGLQGTNPYGMKSTLLAIEGVRSIAIDEHFPPLNHIYNGTVYVDDGTGGLNENLREKIIETINGNDTASNPGCRATGLQFNVSAATAVPINVEVTCKIYRTDHSQALYDIQNAIEEEINSLGIGEDVILTSLILKLRRIAYVKDVPSLLINGDAKTITINKASIARANTPVITLEDM